MASGDKLTILIVDDVSSFRAILRQMLGEIGFADIVEASDGGDAFEKLKSSKAGLVISDYMMAPLNGLDLLREMKNDPAFARTPFIMVSAVGDAAMAQEAMKLGATSCLRKPVDFSELRKNIFVALASMMV